MLGFYVELCREGVIGKNELSACACRRVEGGEEIRHTCVPGKKSDLGSEPGNCKRKKNIRGALNRSWFTQGGVKRGR